MWTKLSLSVLELGLDTGFDKFNFADEIDSSCGIFLKNDFNAMIQQD